MIFLFKEKYFEGIPLGVCLYSTESCFNFPKGWRNEIVSAKVTSRETCYLLFVHDDCDGPGRLKVDYSTQMDIGADFDVVKDAREHQSMRPCTRDERECDCDGWNVKRRSPTNKETDDEK